MKQSVFVEKYLETRNATEAAFTAYDTNRDVARRIGSENLSKPDIRRAIDEALKAYDITPDRWAKVLNGALEAESEMIIGPGQTKTRPDHGTRLKAVDLSAKLADAYPHEPAARHEHRHLHLETTEPIEVMKFKVVFGRAPTELELKELIQPESSPDKTPDET
jgi:phage terminase small subunit